MDDNHFGGHIPDGFRSLLAWQFLGLSNNEIVGSLPCAVSSSTSWSNFVILELSANKLSGSIPYFVVANGRVTQFPGIWQQVVWIHTKAASCESVVSEFVVCIDGNRLTGTLSVPRSVKVLLASGNLFEGTLSCAFNSQLTVLDVSTVPGRSSEAFKGPLPSALRQASNLGMLMLANHQMDGGIPSFTSTLSLLALHRNRFEVLLDIHLWEDVSITLHDNSLSCYLPLCGNATARTSIIAIGNQLRMPKGKFPAWVLDYERDPLLWVSGTDGMSLAVKISGAVGMFVLVVASKLGCARLLEVKSRWQIGPPTHLWIVKASSYLGSCMLKDSLSATAFMMLLLSWDLYAACPQTLAMASACQRSSALIRTLVFLRWCKLSFHSMAVEHLMMEGENQKKRKMEGESRKRRKKKWTETNQMKASEKLLLWLLWCLLTVVLSTPAILYQTSRSIPGFLPTGCILPLVLRACVGTIQGLVDDLIVPYLASRVTWQKHVFTTVSNLLMNFLIPTVVIMCLDTGCLGRWVSLWRPCRGSSRQMFQRRLLCTAENQRDCILGPTVGIDIMVQSSSDICEPHFSWSSTSISNCMHISLLRLQEMLLTKFVMIGLVIPGAALLRDELPTELGIVIGRFGILIANAMLSSGHLPLMSFILLLAFLGQGLVARVAWAEKCFRPLYAQNSAAPAVNIARMFSLFVYLASAAADPCMLAMARAYLFVLIMTRLHRRVKRHCQAGCRLGFTPSAVARGKAGSLFISRTSTNLRLRQGGLVTGVLAQPWGLPHGGTEAT